MSTLDRALSPPKRQPTLNRVMSRVLRSPVSRLVDRSVMLVTVYGRHSGRPYTLPAQYVQDGDVVWILVGNSAQKTWWRNLVGGAHVEIVLRRRARHGSGCAYTFDQQPEVVEEGLRRYALRFPRMVRGLGVRAGDKRSIARAAAQVATVRIHLDH